MGLHDSNGTEMATIARIPEASNPEPEAQNPLNPKPVNRPRRFRDRVRRVGISNEYVCRAGLDIQICRRGGLSFCDLSARY